MKKIIINRIPGQTRIGITQSGALTQLEIIRDSQPHLLNAICAAKVIKVLPGIQAAFVDIGQKREAFLRLEDLLPRKQFKSQSGYAPIEDQLKPGQSLLVQVTKEGHAGKAPVVTERIKLIGFNLVFLAGERHVRYSKKIEGKGLSLQTNLAGLEDLGGGWIVRSFAKQTPTERILHEAHQLQLEYEGIEGRWRASGKPRVLKTGHLDPILRPIKDLSNRQLAGITVDDEDTFKQLKALLNKNAPQLLPLLTSYAGAIPVFEALGLENAIQRALSPRVYLNSGGYLEIAETPGMVVIDVNSGKNQTRKSKREMLLNTNLEATSEIGVQVRLRDLSGMVAIDYIDMPNQTDRQRVDHALDSELKRDGRPVDVLPMNSFCVSLFTRKRNQASLQDRLQTICPSCSGSGHLKNKDTLAFEIRNHLTRDAPGMEGETVTITCDPHLARHLQHQQNALFDALAQKFQITVTVVPSDALLPGRYEIA